MYSYQQATSQNLYSSRYLLLYYLQNTIASYVILKTRFQANIQARSRETNTKARNERIAKHYNTRTHTTTIAKNRGKNKKISNNNEQLSFFIFQFISLASKKSYNHCETNDNMAERAGFVLIQSEIKHVYESYDFIKDKSRLSSLFTKSE